AQRPRDRLRRLQLAAYEPAPEARTSAEADDGARHRAEARASGRRRTSWSIRPAVLARVAFAVVLLAALLLAGAVLTGALQVGTSDDPGPARTLPVPSAAGSAAGDDAGSPSAGE